MRQVAPTPATVLLLGETGSGKEVMAQAIHDLSPRRQKPMIRVNCAAIPTALIESEVVFSETEPPKVSLNIYPQTGEPRRPDAAHAA